MGHILYFFGYTNHPTEENDTAFFNFETHKEEDLKLYYGFKEASASSLKRVCGTDGEGKRVYRYNVNAQATGYDIMPEEMKNRIHDPAHADARKNLGYPARECAPYSTERVLTRGSKPIP